MLFQFVVGDKNSFSQCVENPGMQEIKLEPDFHNSINLEWSYAPIAFSGLQYFWCIGQCFLNVDHLPA